MSKLNTLSRRLVKIGGVSLSIVTFFPTDKTIIDTKYRRDSDVQNITLNFPSFIRFELPYIQGSTVKRSVNLTYMGKIQMVAAMQAMLTNLNSKEVFIEDPDIGLTVTKELKEDGTSVWSVFEQIGESSIVFYPAVVKEEETQAIYKGVGISINNAANHVEMSLAEFIALYHFVKEVDIWSLSQELFNSALMLVGIKALLRDIRPIETSIDKREDLLESRRGTDEFYRTQEEKEQKRKQRRAGKEKPEQEAAEGDGS